MLGAVNEEHMKSRGKERSVFTTTHSVYHQHSDPEHRPYSIQAITRSLRTSYGAVYSSLCELGGIRVLAIAMDGGSRSSKVVSR